MINRDITYCSKTNCENDKCDRNQRNIYKESDKHKNIWIGEFTDCEHWKEQN